MKYVILCDGSNVENFDAPRQLSVVLGERLIDRTIRLLKENKVKDIIITSHDPRFDIEGAKRYEPQNNYYNAKEKIGYWLNAFPIELLNEPITFLLGDVYFSENAIKEIVQSKTKSTLFFCTDKRFGLSEKYIKAHDEPFGYKVVDTELFKKHIEIVKKMFDEGKTRRHPIIWELYRSINGIDVNQHILTENYVAINDETCDVDRTTDPGLMNIRLGEFYMENNTEEQKKIREVRLEAKENFSLSEENFNKLTDVVRHNLGLHTPNRIKEKDVFKCSDIDLVKYLLNIENNSICKEGNPVHRAVVKILEIN